MGHSQMKLQFYMIVVSVIISLMGIAVMKLNQSKPSDNGSNKMTTSQKLGTLQKSVPQSSDMSKFLQHEKASEEMNEKALDDSH